MSLIPFGVGTDINQKGGRRLLQDGFELIANAIRKLQEDVKKVKEADKLVHAVPIEAFPVAVGQIYTGEEGGNVGDIQARAINSTPTGMLPCSGGSYSTTTYADLFAAIGYTYGGAGASFNVPDIQGRVLMGVGSGAGLTTRAMGDTGGVETHPLTSGELAAHTHAGGSHTHTGPSHTHTGPSHNHDMGNHVHGMTHSHNVSTATGAGGGGSIIAHNATTGSTATHSTQSHAANTGVPSPNATSSSGTGSTGSSGTGNTGSASATTGSTGSGTAHQNVQPFVVGSYYIRYRLGPDDVVQTLPISWGQVNAQWRLDTLKNFPSTAVDNVHNVITADLRPEAVVQITGVSGTQAGNSSENKIIGVARVPYNFRGWKPNAFRIRTKVTLTGVAGGSSCTVTLKVSNPLTAGAYLSNTYSRVISEGSGSIADSAYVDAELTSQDLGKNWKPGYLFRFELSFSHPLTFTTATLEVGLLDLRWK